MCSVPVSQFLWDQVEEGLNKALRHLVKDIATTLGQSPDPLTAALKGTLKIHLVEDLNESITQRCTYLCRHTDSPAFIQECGEPILWAHHIQTVQRCPKHIGAVVAASSLMRITPIDVDDLELTGLAITGPAVSGRAVSGPAVTALAITALAVSEDGSVYDGNGIARGFYSGNTLTVFEEV